MLNAANIDHALINIVIPMIMNILINPRMTTYEEHIYELNEMTEGYFKGNA